MSLGTRKNKLMDMEFERTRRKTIHRRRRSRRVVIIPNKENEYKVNVLLSSTSKARSNNQ